MILPYALLNEVTTVARRRHFCPLLLFAKPNVSEWPMEITLSAISRELVTRTTIDIPMLMLGCLRRSTQRRTAVPKARTAVPKTRTAVPKARTAVSKARTAALKARTGPLSTRRVFIAIHLTPDPAPNRRWGHRDLLDRPTTTRDNLVEAAIDMTGIHRSISWKRVLTMTWNTKGTMMLTFPVNSQTTTRVLGIRRCYYMCLTNGFATTIESSCHLVFLIFTLSLLI